MSDFHPCIVRLGQISDLTNSDFLQITTVMNEYPVIIRKGDFKEGQLAAFICYDAVVPDTEQFHFLAPTYDVGSVPVGKRTIKCRKLRGSYSEGLLVPAPPHLNEGDCIIEHFGLIKRVYDEEVSEHPSNKNKGSNENEKSPKTFQLFKYDLEGMAKYGYAFEDGEEVLIAEKLDGENFSMTYAEDKLWVRSRNFFKRNGNKQPLNKGPLSLKKLFFNLKSHLIGLKESIKQWHKPVALSPWWEVPIRLGLEKKLKKYPYLAFFAEFYGNLKSWQYDCKIVNGKVQREIRIFDIYDVKKKRFLEWHDVEAICKEIGLNTVPILYKGPWKTDRSLHSLAEGKSVLGDCVREGFVMRSIPESYHSQLGRKIIKLKGRDYKLAKG